MTHVPLTDHAALDAVELRRERTRARVPHSTDVESRM
jgi:hypothetical protein